MFQIPLVCLILKCKLLTFRFEESKLTPNGGLIASVFALFLNVFLLVFGIATCKNLVLSAQEVTE